MAEVTSGKVRSLIVHSRWSAAAHRAADVLIPHSTVLPSTGKLAVETDFLKQPDVGGRHLTLKK